ncbi:Uncharacterized protein TCM_026072 [Theobroma cacao]|uniref:Uncharacterized protein n=1 Tax=Theobroma cacao TaxID=3641 RepID=A0A061F1J5_THECC|nr:Uncharacterized protein TCM_026072 [Theobroma cacao]
MDSWSCGLASRLMDSWSCGLSSSWSGTSKSGSWLQEVSNSLSFEFGLANQISTCIHVWGLDLLDESFG